MLANAEVATFFRSEERLDQALLETAWNLHQVGIVRPQLGLYTHDRQVHANSVAAHIFDLALNEEGLSTGDQLVLTFAAQVSSIRGDRAPNATALGRRLPAACARPTREPGMVSQELGCSLLSLDRGRTARLLRDLADQSAAVDVGATRAWPA